MQVEVEVEVAAVDEWVVVVGVVGLAVADDFEVVTVVNVVACEVDEADEVELPEVVPPVIVPLA